jgi:hypothetical protein
MEAKEKKYHWKYAAGLILGIVLCLTFYVMSNDNLANENANLKIEKDYYKTQMMQFCTIAEIHVGEEYPDSFPCEKQLIEGEGK